MRRSAETSLRRRARSGSTTQVTRDLFRNSSPRFLPKLRIFAEGLTAFVIAWQLEDWEGDGWAGSTPFGVRIDRLAGSKSGRGLRALLQDAGARSKYRQHREPGQITNTLQMANPRHSHECPNGRFIGTNNITKKADWFS